MKLCISEAARVLKSMGWRPEPGESVRFETQQGFGPVKRGTILNAIHASNDKWTAGEEPTGPLLAYNIAGDTPKDDVFVLSERVFPDVD